LGFRGYSLIENLKKIIKLIFTILLLGRLIMINSGAREALFYEAPRGNRVNINSDEVSEINWASVTGVLGNQLEGIWYNS
jgi:hypothetical protein